MLQLFPGTRYGMKKTIILAITMGDPGGIGPEIALKAVYCSKWPDAVRFLLIGSRDIWLKSARKLNLPQPYECKNAAETVKQKIGIWDPIPLNNKRISTAGWRPGRTGKSEGFAALLWIRAAIAGCLDRTFQGMVTGPICKQSMQAAGFDFPGHTEYLAHLAGSSQVAMMLMGGPLRVVLATRHIALKQVAGALKRQTVIDAARMAAAAVNWLHLPQKTIGICALNPHAGEGGLLGDEERKIIIPAVRQLRQRGISVKGPIPADVIFYQARQGKFGAVVAMYHDQGLGPLKMIAFEKGVNLTLGLPFVRTSPDHGTALDIAGKGVASYSSMVEAIRLSVKLARRPNPWKK